MKPEFINFLCCPETGDDLHLVNGKMGANGLIESGFLKTKSGKTYPIVNQVPRFVKEESYSGSFGFEWKRWSRVQFEDQNTNSRLRGHTTSVFDRATGLSEQKINRKTVVEFGCGPGRFLDIVRKRDGIAVGLELSSAADVARANFKNDANVLIVQGDILHPPFKKNSFDFGYSIGVFHHTPAPEVALQKLVDVVKTKGEITCCVYENNNGRGLYDSSAVIWYRTFLNSISSHLSRPLALAYSYFSAYVLYWFFFPAFKIPGLRVVAAFLTRNFVPGLFYLRDGKWRVLDTFDAITPKFATTHTPEELRAWFEKAGCTAIMTMPFGKTSFRGIK
ncbi:MAG: class I SAM-dependent methyltransferase [bacterium]